MKSEKIFKLPKGYSVSISHTAFNDDISGSVFFTRSYFKALEQAALPGFSYIYAVLCKGHSRAALMYFQVIDFSTMKIGSVIHTEPYGKFMKLVSDKITSTLLSKNRKRRNFLLVNGNMCVSGNYGIALNEAYKTDFTHIYNDITEKVKEFISEEGDVSISLVKDFPFDNDILCKSLTSEGYIRFVMDPVMLVNIQPSWNKFDDYLKALSSKYRLRTVNVLEKCAPFELRELELADIEKHRSRMEVLYQAVIHKSPVRVVQFDMQYIIELKRHLKDRFIIKAWFAEEMVAFFTAFQYHKVTEAHHIGLDYHLNRAHALYQNILYGLIDIAIAHKSHKLDYGRTAMEMKSTVGAVPENFAVYLKMSSKVMNHLIKPFLPAAPSESWQQRLPFRDQTD